MDLLETHFRAANLACVVTAEPIEHGRGANGEVVQMDIARTRRGEEFRVYRGAASNRVIATSFDRKARQLLLMVHEPRRRFETTLSKLQPVPRSIRIVFEDNRIRIVENFTSERKRHFLCGMDESHLFIAQLPRAAPSVAEAHRILRPPRIDARVKRQGEWFFVEPNAGDLLDIEVADATAFRTHIGIAQASRLARVGRQHVADEVCVLGGRVFVRGAIRHPDHKTVRFLHWMSAIPNTEELSAQPEGVSWVD